MNENEKLEQKELYYKESRKVSIISIWVDAILSFGKIFFGILGHSQVIFLDGIHSLSDLVTDLVTFFIIKVANEPPDEEHPYGHGKIETIAALMISILLFIVVFYLFKNSIALLSQDEQIIPESYTIIIAFLSVLFKEILFRYTLVKGKNINSRLLIANAHHHRSDALSSVAALIGLVFVIYTPFKYGESIASFIVILMILHAAYEIGKEAFWELVDTVVELDEKIVIIEKILKLEYLYHYHNFRIIQSGVSYKVEIDIELEPTLDVVTAHDISKVVKNIIQEEIPNAIHVIVHIDPFVED